MKISVHGLGYVGCVAVGCLSELGHEIIGVDIEPNKVSLISGGQSTVLEKDIDGLIKENFERGLITATSDGIDAIMQADAAVVCIGTPNDPNGHLDMSGIEFFAHHVSKALKTKNTFFTIAIRSTVMPGTNRKLVELISEESGKIHGEDFAVVSNPEFLREGSSVADFFNPPFTIIASDSIKGIEVMREVYDKINSEIIVTDIGTAELIKFVNNSYHGLKVVFANEVGRICKALGVDSRLLMDLFVKDKSLNISPSYFKPGFAYGGSCLPKDLKALNSIGHDHYLNLPVLSAIESSNQLHIEYALSLIMKKNKRKIGFYGISFKSGTDDLRFSPAIELIERLLGKGYDVRIFDKHVTLSRLMGKNKEYLLAKLPHINKYIAQNLDQFLESLDLLIVVNKDEQMDALLDKVRNKIEIVDLASVAIGEMNIGMYDGICW